MFEDAYELIPLFYQEFQAVYNVYETVELLIE